MSFSSFSHEQVVCRCWLERMVFGILVCMAGVGRCSCWVDRTKMERDSGENEIVYSWSEGHLLLL